MSESSPVIDVNADNGSTVTIDGSANLIGVGAKIYNELSKQLESEVPEIAAKVAADRDKQRQYAEDKRANRRNRNRTYTMLVALCFTFLVPFVIAQMGAVELLKYTTGIAILPDTLITLYAWHKRY